MTLMATRPTPLRDRALAAAHDLNRPDTRPTMLDVVRVTYATSHPTRSQRDRGYAALRQLARDDLICLVPTGRGYRVTITTAGRKAVQGLR